MPTANGRLSFRHVGDAKHSRFITKYANYVNDQESRARRVAAFQRRNLSDILFPFVVERLNGRSGNFWFTLACLSTDEVDVGDAKLDALIGEVCIFKSKEDWASFSNAASLIAEMDDLRRKRRFWQADERFAAFKENAKKLSDIQVPFKLLRNGEIYVGEPKVADEELNINSSRYSSDRIGVAFNGWIANHAYFFVRDLCHFHQHHLSAEDTIIILQDVDTERGWRNNILYSLHHYVIGQRRSAWLIDQYRANGVLAYARSFEGISRIAAPDAKLQEFQIDAIADSINAKIKELDSDIHEWEQSKSWRIARLSSYRGAGITILAISCSLLISIMQPYFQQHRDTLLHVDKWFAAHSGAVFSATLICLIVLFTITDERAYRHTRPHLNWVAIRRNVFGFRDFATLGMFSPVIFGSLYILISALMITFILLRPI